MAHCGYCRSTILFGGIHANGYQFCNSTCAQKGHPQKHLNRPMPQVVHQDYLNVQVSAIHQGACPRCHGKGPIDVHIAHRIWSLIIRTSWNSRLNLCCRRCGRTEQVKGILFSLVLGWWGFPWGFIMTPVQIVKNLIGILQGPHHSKPSNELYDLIQTTIQEQNPIIDHSIS
jgi:hypothetical protein